MGRPIPTEYNPPDPDRSFVAGTETIINESGDGADPHGLGDLQAAVRYLYAYAQAGLIVPQFWRSADWFGVTANAFQATPDIFWYVPPDTAFDAVEVLIYYEANVAHVTAGFRVKLQETGEVFDLPTADAGGATRRASGVWSSSDIQTVEDFATFELYTKGDGVDRNRVKAAYIRRVALSGNIPAGKFYGGQFITPDTVAAGANTAFSSDKVTDITNCLRAMLQNRRKVYLVWGSLTTFTGHLAVLNPLHASSFGRTHTAHLYSTGNQTVDIYGDAEGNEPLFKRSTTCVANTKATGNAYLSPQGVVNDSGGVFSIQFGQYVVKIPATGLKTATIEGV